MILSIYGISGVGKTALCHEIERMSSCFEIVDGSALMNELIPGGLAAFKQMSQADKYRQREVIIREIDARHRSAPYHTIVTGHYSFLKPDGSYEVAWTDADGDVYDQIFCIDADAEQILKQCRNDIGRSRAQFSDIQIQSWQNYEMQHLARVCQLQNIPFSRITSPDIKGRGVEFFKHLSRQYIKDVSELLLQDEQRGFAIFDCDGTLFSGDCLDYQTASDGFDTHTVCSIFKRRDKYCFESFFDVARYYATCPRTGMSAFIERAAAAIVLPSEILELLSSYAHMSLVWITSGFPEIWEAVAKRYGIQVYVVGGNDLAKQATIVSNEEKALLVQFLRKSGEHVIAFGDSMVDCEMLDNASEAVVVVSNKRRHDLFDYLKNHPNLSSLDLRHTAMQEVNA